MVTNEVGWGIIPENKLSRKYVDNLGLLNKKVASLSDNVYLMVSGIGVKIK
nr:bifunctional adenosylcobinamide kinase/adenosylcobinamide-phosphate guanylyltransferase [Thermosipho africanus]